MEALKEFAGAIATLAVALVTGMLAWLGRIEHRTNAAHRRVGKTNERVSVLENEAQHSTVLLKEIREEIRGLRKEFRDELKAKQDRDNGR